MLWPVAAMASPAPERVPSASVRVDGDAAGSVRLVLEGRLDAGRAGSVWGEALERARECEADPLVVDCSAIDYCDGAGASILVALRELQEARGRRLEVRGLREEFARILALIEPSGEAAPAPPSKREGLLVALGRSSLGFFAELRSLVVFTGEITVCLGRALRHPRSIRFRDVVVVAERAGIGAIPIIALVGFLLGLILAFQSAVSLQRFGAQIFVADFIGIAMFRELGPLMAAILLTARSGSAFAAEIGTMKVNEEIDALTTMGLEPVRFLVIPRVLAAVLVIPALILLMDLAGVVGGLAMFLTLDYPVVTFWNRVVEATSPGDLLGGLFKGAVYGVIVAAVGCLRGTETGTGASAVGESTTSAVVSGIVLIAVTAAIFSIVFYVLGI